VVDLVDLVGQSFTIVGSGRYLSTKEHDSLVIDVERQKFYWNSRGVWGDAYDWLMKVIGISYWEAREFLGEAELPSPPRIEKKPERPRVDLTEFAMECHSVLLGDKGLMAELMESRRLTEQTVIRAHLGWHKRRRGWTIPYFYGIKCFAMKVRLRQPDSKGKYRAVKGSKFSLPYITPPHKAMKKSRLFIVEGEFKALHIWQLGAPAIATSATAFRKEWAKLDEVQKAREVYVFRDNDFAGLKFSESVMRAIPRTTPLAPPPEYKGVDDWIVAEQIPGINTLIRLGQQYI